MSRGEAELAERHLVRDHRNPYRDAERDRGKKRRRGHDPIDKIVERIPDQDQLACSRMPSDKQPAFDARASNPGFFADPETPTHVIHSLVAMRT